LNGMEWLVDIFGCPANVLQDRRTMSALFNTVVREMRLHPMGDPVWHQFPTTKGMTGFWEYESACFNLFCCSPRTGIDWQSMFSRMIQATSVSIRECPREYSGNR